jgi:thioredoxin reductase (NADPH)
MPEAKPILLAVDDEPAVLSAVSRDLRARYAERYRIVRAGSGHEALEALAELRRRGASVALMLSDQRMPGMDGTTFLARASELHPRARKVLLTAYADTNAAIAGINEVGLDHYVLKPWDPPEQALYPLLDDLLDAWWADNPPPFDGFRVIGPAWSAASHAVKEFLARNRVPYRFIDVDADADAPTLLADLGAADAPRPVVVGPDGSWLGAPDRGALAAKVGLSTHARTDFYDLVVVGAGPAGLGAGVYGASEGLRTLLIEREATGGQAGTSSRIENYLGFPQGLSGAELATRATTQARRFGVEILHGEVVGLRVESPTKWLRLADGTEIGCFAVIVATGVQVRTLEVHGADRLAGAGLYYGASLTEAATYRERDIVIVGGGNSAGQAALHFALYAAKVTILVRRDSLVETMSSYLVDRIQATPNIEVVGRREIVELGGAEVLERIVVEDLRDGSRTEMPVAAVFVFVGATPRTEVFDRLLVRSTEGYLLTGSGLDPAALPGGHRPGWLETNVPGVFAAGDVRHGSSKRVAAAVGEGAVAVGLVHQYLQRV